MVNKSIEKQVRFQHKRASSVLTRSATPESSIASSDESDSEATVSTDTDNPDCSKIPKPEGEPGRPGRGGYNLERAIGWPVKDYKCLKVLQCHCTSLLSLISANLQKYVHQMVETHLEVGSAYSTQSLASIQKIQDRVCCCVLKHVWY